MVNDGDGEVKVRYWVQQAIDVESTSNNDARDQASELEMKVLVDGKQDDTKVVKVIGVADEQNNNEPNVLECNGVVGVGEMKITKGLIKKYNTLSVPVETSTSTALVSCDGLGGYDWSDQAEEGPNYALMAFLSSSSDSEVSNDSICSKSCLETVKLLKSQNDQLLKDLKKSELMVLVYKTGLESVEEKLKFYKSNKSIYLQDIKGLKFEIQIGEITIRWLRKKLEIVQKEKDGIQLNVDKFEHASKSLNKLIECQIVDNCKKGLGYENYNAVPPPYIEKFMPTTTDLTFTGLDEFVNKPVVENCKAMSSEEEPKGNPQMDLQDQGVIDSGCSRHMTGKMSYLTDYEEIDGGYVAFGGNPKGGKIKGKGTIKTDNLDFENVYFVRELNFNLFIVSQMCDKKNSVLFNDMTCIVLSPNFKLLMKSSSFT
ncbi:hypothetical protein Tco_0758389 [Tanacetum coccineum]